MRINRRKLGGGLLVTAGIVLLILPFLFTPPSQPSPSAPPPTSGNRHGGSNRGGGTTPPPCGTNCQSSTDTTTHDNNPSERLARMASNNIMYFYPSITLTFQAIDDQNLSIMTFNDNGTVTNFRVQGRASSNTMTLTTPGLHILLYYSTDRAANKENPAKQRSV